MKLIGYLFLPFLICFSGLSLSIPNYSSYVKDNKSPLLWAVLQKKYNDIEDLLKSGSNPNILYMNEPLLHYVIKQGELAIATLMVNAGANFNDFIDGEQDAFTYISTHYNSLTAGKKGNKGWRYIDCDLLYAFISNGYNIKSNFNDRNLQNNAWYLSLKNNQLNRIHFLLNQNPEYSLPDSADLNQIFNLSNNTSSTPLLLLLEAYLKNFATEESRKKALNTGTISTFPPIANLVKSGANINQATNPDNAQEQQNPLSYALSKNDDGYIISSLIQYGASINEGFKYFITNGGSANYYIQCRWLSAGVTVSLLGIAIEQNNLEVVKMLLNAGAHVNQLTCILKEKNLRTPLYHAFQKGNPELIELLLDHGAQIGHI